MNETELENALGAEGLGFGIVFQVSCSDGALVIVINRPDPGFLDYNLFKVRIVKILENFDLTGISILYLYSRVLGLEECDWQDQLAIANPDKDNPVREESLSTNQDIAPIESQEAIALANSELIEAEVKPKEITPKEITQYRFGLSDYLIETVSEPPESDIAEIVISFDRLSQTDKQTFLPALENFFVNQDRNAFVGLLPELSDLGQKIEQLSNRKRRSAAIWLARYCVKGEEILAIARKGHVPPTESTSQNLAPINPNTSAVQTTNSDINSTPNSTPNTSPRESPREPRRTPVANRSVQQTNSAISTSNSNILPMAIALAVAGVLSGWLFNGSMQAAGWIAFVGFTHGFIWAVGVSYGNQLFLGSTIFNIGAIIFFRGYLWSQAIGVFTGFALAAAVKLSLKTPKNSSEQLFGKRGGIAIAAILIGMILGITLLGGKNPTVASSVSSSGISAIGGNNIYIADEGEISMSEAISKGTVSLRIENKSAADCLLTIQLTIVEKSALGGTSTKTTGEPTKFAQAPANKSTDLPFTLSPGTYRIACQENYSGGASFEVVP
jgi:hypothetical protein